LSDDRGSDASQKVVAVALQAALQNRVEEAQAIDVVLDAIEQQGVQGALGCVAALALTAGLAIEAWAQCTAQLAGARQKCRTATPRPRTAPAQPVFQNGVFSVDFPGVTRDRLSFS
jgi:hypothetical protein